MICFDCIHKDVCRDFGCTKVMNGCKNYISANKIVELPCVIGDTLYTNMSLSGSYLRSKNRPFSVKVVYIGLNDSKEFGFGYLNVIYPTEHMWQFRFSEIGKNVFLTKEEAEEGLKKLEEQKKGNINNG